MVGVISVHHVDKSNAIFHPRPRWMEKKIHTVLFSIHMDQECLIAIVHIILVDGQMLKMHCVMSFSLPFFKIYREICTLHSRLWLMYAAFWNLITGLQDFLCIRDINPSTVHNACLNVLQAHSNTHTHLTAFFPGLPRWAGTRKVKPIWILLKQETVSGSGVSWAICKSASCPTTQVFTARCYASAVLAMGLCLCPSVCHKSEFY